MKERSIILKTMSPKHYLDLGDNSIRQATKYFLRLMIVVFILAMLLFIPKAFSISTDISNGLLSFTELIVDLDIETERIIAIPSENPIIVIDTTGEYKQDKELFFITQKNIYIGDLEFDDEIDLLDKKELTKNNIVAVLLFLAPGFIFGYYVMYLIKYLLIIILSAGIVTLFAKIFKNKIHIRQAIVLSIYTSTPMIIIEILSFPFPNNFLISFSPIIGFNISLIAITIYYIFYITAIRINGSEKLRR